jgi:hypothetical protein
MTSGRSFNVLADRPWLNENILLECIVQVGMSRQVIDVKESLSLFDSASVAHYMHRKRGLCCSVEMNSISRH